MAGFPGGDDELPPEGEGFVVDEGPARGPGGSERPGDSGGSGRGGWRRPPTRSARRVAVVLGVLAVFAFGVLVGRTAIGHRDVSGAPSPATTGTPSLVTSPELSTPVAIAPTPTDATSATEHSTSPAGRSTSPATEAGGPTSSANAAFSATINDSAAPGSGTVQSLAVVGNQLVVLARGYFGRISRAPTGDLFADGGRRVGLPIGDPTYSQWTLVSDGNDVWAISQPASRIYRAHLPTMSLTAQSVNHQTVSAAALDGHLYQNTTSGVFDIAPAGDAGERPTVARGGRAMAADPSRHRLLLLNDDDGWAVTAYRPPQDDPVASHSLPFSAQAIAVAGDQIWVTGTSRGDHPHPVLARLDPSTLTVAGHSVLEKSLAAPPTIVATGIGLWVRDAPSDQLWCVDAHDGTVAQYWSSMLGMVAARGGAAYVAHGDTIGQLRLNGSCAG